MFEFGNAQRAPQIILNETTGEVEHETPGEGPTGITGPEGPAGKDGATGPAGANGKDGATGPKGATGATGPRGPRGARGPKGDTPVVKCKVTGQGKKQTIKCSTGGSSGRSRALLTVVRDHKVVAHGAGRLGSSFRLEHAHPLHGRYTLFIAIPGVTTSSQKVSF
jgi:hypothetical protein